MTYSDFTLDTLKKTFSLQIVQQPLLPGIEPVAVPAWLQEAIEQGLSLALSSEKARSEFIVAPILLALRKLTDNRFAIYSGQHLDIDATQGLVGECDFILACTQPLPVLQAPLVTIVEAKKNDVETGLGQCAAQMIGARLFNQREGNDITTLFGCVTTGETWQFLKLSEDTLSLDSRHYYIDRLEIILGVWLAIIAYDQPAQVT
jgi:hypothetical protein